MTVALLAFFVGGVIVEGATSTPGGGGDVAEIGPLTLAMPLTGVDVTLLLVVGVVVVVAVLLLSAAVGAVVTEVLLVVVVMCSIDLESTGGGVFVSVMREPADGDPTARGTTGSVLTVPN